MPVQTIDAAALIDLFNHRVDARQRGNEEMVAYWAGRIDGHCLQNAIDDREMRDLAHFEGFRVDWDTAMGAA